jgi:membrane protease YdiL (CAAX protease family)
MGKQALNKEISLSIGEVGGYFLVVWFMNWYLFSLLDNLFGGVIFTAILKITLYLLFCYIIVIDHFKFSNPSRLLTREFNNDSFTGTAIFLALLLVYFGFNIVIYDEMIKLINILFPLNFKGPFEIYLSSIELNMIDIIINLGLIPGIFEEIIFRGFFLNGLKTRYNKYFALVISSVLFALIHTTLYQMVIWFWIGLLIGFIYLKTDSLALAIFLHLSHNFIFLFRLQQMNFTQYYLNILGAKFIPIWQTGNALADTGGVIFYFACSEVS